MSEATAWFDLLQRASGVLSQSALARMLGIDRTTLYRWLAGKARPWNPEEVALSCGWLVSESNVWVAGMLVLGAKLKTAKTEAELDSLAQGIAFHFGKAIEEAYQYRIRCDHLLSSRKGWSPRLVVERRDGEKFVLVFERKGRTVRVRTYLPDQSRPSFYCDAAGVVACARVLLQAAAVPGKSSQAAWEQWGAFDARVLQVMSDETEN